MHSSHALSSKATVSVRDSRCGRSSSSPISSVTSSERKITVQMFAHPSFMTELRSHLTVNQQLMNKCPRCKTAAVLPAPEQLERPMPAPGAGHCLQHSQGTRKGGREQGKHKHLWKSASPRCRASSRALEGRQHSEGLRTNTAR